MHLSESLVMGGAKNNCDLFKIEFKISRTCMSDTLKYVSKIRLDDIFPASCDRTWNLRSSRPLLSTFISSKTQRSIDSHILSRQCSKRIIALLSRHLVYRKCRLPTLPLVSTITTTLFLG